MDDTYALTQWAQALDTAATTDDATTRRNAQRRVRAWERVVDGMRSGALHIGSRTPLRGRPAWVTPEVVRGGFVTGRAAARGALSAFERDLAREAGLPGTRAAVFAHAVSGDGIRRLWSVLDDGTAEVDVPEAAALLVVAWLVRAGDVDGARTLVETIAPLSRDLRFLPASVGATPQDPTVMWRQDAGTVTAALRGTRTPAAVERMNDVLGVWHPFADRLLEHWLAATVDGRLVAPPDAAWLDAGRALLAEFDRLAAQHTPPRRHTDPKENAALLRRALVTLTSGKELSAREHGRVRTALTDMVARRGAPGSARLRELRDVQRAQAAAPTRAALAHLAADRLAAVPASTGVADPTPFVAPVADDEARATGLPAGAPLPPSVHRAVRRATAGTLDELVAAGVVPSAEVLAALVPQVTAQAVAEAYPDPALRTVVVRTYEAFRRRRTLLLLDLQQQVGVDELPWFAAAAAHARVGDGTRDVARATFLRVADAAVTHWPGTVLPNPLVSELSTLATAAGVDVPWVEEIAADIFMGRFSSKFARAFELAGAALVGSVYGQYYGITEADVARVRTASRPDRAFSELCTRRSAADPQHRWCTVCHGMVVEQAQILTTHDLATLVAAGYRPSTGWRAVAEGAFTHTATLVARLDGNRDPLRTLKDAAYAWRQTVFAAAQLGEQGLPDLLAWARQEAGTRSPYARRRMLGLVHDLAHPGGRPPFVGWVHGRHPLLDDERGRTPDAG